ncbi:MAG TPA: hypothetical protein PLQ89_08410 [Phycisphaerae bacterium]|nr:hypothetical protein [Phycisphaerae bacterium]HOQ85729.1 hypothetical protein [Phycisphaerae bacterium]
MTGLLDRLLRRPKSLRGGIFLPVPAFRTSGPLQPLPAPSVLDVPLIQHDGPAATPLVKAGQQVEAGQRIAKATVRGALGVHAPAAGRVTGVVAVDTAWRSNVPAVRIEVDIGRFEQDVVRHGNAGVVRGAGDRHATELPSVDLDALVAAAEWAGLIDFQPSPTSLAECLRQTGGRRIAQLIVNTLAGDLACLPAGPPSRQDCNALVRAADWLGRILAVERVWIAVDRADRAMVRSLRVAARHSRIAIAALVNKYPQRAPVLLAHRLTGRATPPGAGTLDAGVLVLEAQSLMQLADVVQERQRQPDPATSAPLPSWLVCGVVTVAGPAMEKAVTYSVPFGTSFAHILSHAGLKHTPRRVIEGGPLTGRAVGHLDVVTTKRTSTLLVLDRASDRVPVPGPCIRCGWCQDDCPVGLDPRALLNLAERADVSRAAALYPQACLECGVCSYVCPAELPLAEGVMTLKRAVMNAGSGNAKKMMHHQHDSSLTGGSL